MSLQPPQCLTNWPTNHQNHRATGLAYHGTEQKAAVLLWDTHTVVVHKSRQFGWALRGDHPPDKTISMPLVPDTVDAAVDDVIQAVLAGAQETCVLTSAGRLLTCEKSPSGLRLQSLNTESALGRVHCACVTRIGGLAIVCSSESPVPGSLHVYVLPAALAEALAGNDAERVCKFDISLEPNELQSTWQSRQMGIVELAPVADTNGRSVRFFQLLRGQSGEQCSPGQGYIFLTINNQLLALIGDDHTDDCHMHVVQTFAVEICNCWLSAAGDALFIQLTSGVLEVLHVSDLLPDCATLQRSFISFGDEIVCSRMRVDDDVFVYATEQEVIQAKIAYRKSSEQFSVEWRRAVNIYGVIAIEFVRDARHTLLLTENGFLYTMSWFVGDDDDELMRSQQIHTLHKVDDAFIERSHRQLADIVRITADSQQSLREIRQLKRQQDLLQLAHQQSVNKSSESLFRASLSASKTIPDTVDKHTIYAGRGEQALLVTHETFFVCINLQLTTDERVGKKWHLDDEKLWTLCIREIGANSAKTTTVRCVRLIAGMFGNRQHDSCTRSVNIVLSTSCPTHLQLPEFTMDLHAFVRNGSDFQHLSFAVSCEAIDIGQLFRLHSGADPPFTSSALMFGSKKSPAALEYRMRLPISIDWPHLLAILDPHCCTADVLDGKSTVYVGLLERWVRVSVQQDGNVDGHRVWSLNSGDAGAMYEVKMRLLAGMQKQCDTLAASWRPKPALLRDILNIEEFAKDVTSADDDYVVLLMRKLIDVRSTCADC